MSNFLNSVQDSPFNIGKLHFQNGEFIKAREILSDLFYFFLKNESVESGIACLNMLVRIYIELDDLKSLDNLFDFLQKNKTLSIQAQENPKFLYCLGIHAIYSNKHDEALNFLEKSMSLSIQRSSFENLAQALIPIIKIYCDGPLKDLKKAKLYFEQLRAMNSNIKSNKDLLLGLQISEMELLIAEGNYQGALTHMLEAYEFVKFSSCKSFYINTTFANLGELYYKMGLYENAQLFLTLAKKGIINENYVRMCQNIDLLLNKIQLKMNRSLNKTLNPKIYIQFNQKDKILIFNKNQKNSLKLENQFVLIDVLTLFLKNPGTIFTKEKLVKSIWNQDYNPSHHDNLIYVTIKRIRSLFQKNNLTGFKSILRDKNGYYFNPEASIEIKESHEETSPLLLSELSPVT